MDQKKWLPRKKSPDKLDKEMDKPEFSLKGSPEEGLRDEKEAGPERSLKDLCEKLASLARECEAKDKLVADLEQEAREAIAGKEKSEVEAASFERERDEARGQKAIAAQKIGLLNSALKECRQQFNSSREENDRRIREAVTSSKIELEKKFAEMTKTVTSLTVENSQLSKALLVKERLIDDAREQMSRATGELNSMISRLDSTEKENALLKYELSVLDRELKIRNKEMELGRQAVNASRKQLLERMDRIATLEAECQKLRAIARKRTKSELEVPRTNRAGKPNLNEVFEKRLGFMIERLREFEEENKSLKEIASIKDGELRSVRTELAALTTSKLSPWKAFGDRQTADLPECQKIGVSEMSLMDDFVEMEKLAIVSINAPVEASCISSESNLALSIKNPIESHSDSAQRPNDWILSLIREIFDQNRESGRSIDELLEDITIILQHKDHSNNKLHPICGYLPWKSGSDGATGVESSSGTLSSMDECEGLKNELEKARSACENSEKSVVGLMSRIEELDEEIGNLKREVEGLEESKRLVEEQMENQKTINEDLDTQLTVARAHLNEALRKMSSMEVELEDRIHCCTELEATCLELQLQLESVSNEEDNDSLKQNRKALQNGYEITVLSARLAECQETVTSLEKQLKSIISSKGASTIDGGIVSAAADRKLPTQRSSLRDHMTAEDVTRARFPQSPPKIKEIITAVEAEARLVSSSTDRNGSFAGEALAIVQSKRKGGRGNWFLRKLLSTRKRGSGKKTSLFFAK